MKVLLIIDALKDFFPGGPLGVDDAENIVPVINELMRAGEYDLIVAINDSHPSDHVSYVDNHPGEELGQLLTLPDGRVQMMWPRHCEQGTDGARFHSELLSSLIDQVLPKGIDSNIDSYSAFFDNERAKSTGLYELLQQEAVKRGEEVADIKLDLTGLALDWCVKFSALDARSLELETRLVLDATRAVNLKAGDDLAALREMREAGVEVIDSREILAEQEVERGKQRGAELSP